MLRGPAFCLPSFTVLAPDPAHYSLWPSPGLFSLSHRLMTNYVTFVVGEVLLLTLTVCSLAAIFPRVRSTFPFGSELSGSEHRSP